MAMSPFGLYHHVTAGNVPDTSNFALVTVRGDGDVTTLLKNRGNTRMFLYRRGTAVGDADAAAFGRDHPDWLMHDRGGRVVTSNAGGDVIDITNPAVRHWLVDGLRRDVDAGAYDGVYLDVLGAFFSQRFYSGRPFIAGAPLDDAAWRDASVALIREVKAATGKPVIANGFGWQSGKNYADHKADADQVIAAADGIQIEQFVRNGNTAADQYAAPARWREDVDLLGAVGRMDKIVLADTRVRNADDKTAVDKQRTYALASFLVGAEGPARFRFATGALTGEVDTSMADTINALGAPKGDAHRDGDAMTREFDGGSVRVDPVSHTASIDTGRASNAAEPTSSSSARRGRTTWIVVAAVIVLLLLAVFLMRRRRRTA
jgi:hypothetical protein